MWWKIASASQALSAVQRGARMSTIGQSRGCRRETVEKVEEGSSANLATVVEWGGDISGWNW